MSRRKRSRRETLRERRQRARRVLDRLRARHPGARCGLAHRDPWQLLVSVVLSAQCTDERVNRVTPSLFARYPRPEDLARAAPQDLHTILGSLGLFRTKSRSLVAAARAIVAERAGEVPRTREELDELPGVGAKSAGVIAGSAFGVPALPVDTHVGRVARRLGLTRERDPAKVERDLCRLWPISRWLTAHHTLVLHGRETCRARKPECAQCAVASMCPSASP